MEHHRAEALRSQVTAWQEAQVLTTYLVALRDTHGTDPTSSEWINWIEKYIERLNPLTTPPVLVKAHQKLDAAVDAAYGKKSFKNDAERVAFLFELYQKYTSLLPAIGKPKSRRKG